MFRFFLVLVFLGIAAPGLPCSAMAQASPAELVGGAEVIVRVRAEGLSRTLGRIGGVAESPTQIRFVVLEILKGKLSSRSIEFNGELTERDDRNDHRVPYEMVRPEGRAGSCFATTYRAGAEYLLLLRRSSLYADKDALTPYWATLQPTNEQLFGGPSDAWFLWVKQELLRRH